MTIRQATLSDIPQILTFLREILAFHHKGRPDLFLPAGEKYNAEELTKVLSDPSRPVLVAAEEDRLFGYAFCVLKESTAPLIARKTLYLDDLFVASLARGKGIGTLLMDEVVNLARREGCYNVTLNVWEFPESAKAFYEAYGMRVQRTTMEKIL